MKKLKNSSNLSQTRTVTEPRIKVCMLITLVTTHTLQNDGRKMHLQGVLANVYNAASQEAEAEEIVEPRRVLVAQKTQ